MKGSGLLPLLFPVFLRKWFPGSPAHKQFFHPAPEACGNPGVPGQHAVGGSAAWGFPASICVFETKNGEYGNKDSYSFLLKDVKNNK